MPGAVNSTIDRKSGQDGWNQQQSAWDWPSLLKSWNLGFCPLLVSLELAQKSYRWYFGLKSMKKYKNRLKTGNFNENKGIQFVSCKFEEKCEFPCATAGFIQIWLNVDLQMVDFVAFLLKLSWTFVNFRGGTFFHEILIKKRSKNMCFDFRGRLSKVKCGKKP